MDSLTHAKHAAVQTICESLLHAPAKFWENMGYGVTVSDGDGLILFTVDMVASLAPAVHAHQLRK